MTKYFNQTNAANFDWALSRRGRGIRRRAEDHRSHLCRHLHPTRIASVMKIDHCHHSTSWVTLFSFSLFFFSLLMNERWLLFCGANEILTRGYVSDVSPINPCLPLWCWCVRVKWGLFSVDCLLQTICQAMLESGRVALRKGPNFVPSWFCNASC